LSVFQKNAKKKPRKIFSGALKVLFVQHLRSGALWASLSESTLHIILFATERIPPGTLSNFYPSHHFRRFFSLSLVSDTLGASHVEPPLNLNINLSGQFIYDFDHTPAQNHLKEYCRLQTMYDRDHVFDLQMN